MKYVALLKPDNDVLLNGDNCCLTLSELYQAVADINTTEIEITKEFADNYFTYSALCNFVEMTAAITPNIDVIVNDEMFDTQERAVRNLKNLSGPDEFIYLMERNPTKLISTIKMLCRKFEEANTESNIANNKIATMMVQIEELKSELETKENSYEHLMKTYNDVDAKLRTLVSRINFQFNKDINPDTLFNAEHNRFNHVLYVKEITRVHYTDTLMYYLREIIKTMYEAPVRMVVIEPPFSYDRNTLYPGFKPHWELTYRDVMSNDIYMAGYQTKLMEDILKNPNHTNYLIVLDRSGHNGQFVSGNNVTTIYTVSDLKDIDPVIEQTKIISYNDETLYIPYIDDFNSLSPEDRIQKYSSMKVTKELIKYLEEVEH